MAAAAMFMLWLAGPWTSPGDAQAPPPLRPPEETTLPAPTALSAAAAPATGDVFCPICGARNRTGSRFCFKDGTPLPAIDPGRFAPRFVRGSETYAPEEIQRAIRSASLSVVRIRAHFKADVSFPVVSRTDVSGYFTGVGHIERISGETGVSGSGFVISPQGEVVTNAHVASPFGAEARLTVETQDGRSFLAHLVGIDRASDLALLKVDTGSIPPLAWGDDEQLHLGEETWAIGNPLDIGIAVTRGTISSNYRMRVGFNQVESYLHSDAFITHGNSGGPLVDLLGRVVGVSDMGFHEEKGQGYSIPASMARRVIDRVRQRGKYERGFLGLQVRSIDSEAARKYAITRTDGVAVDSVLPGSAAAGAGFRPGDVLFGINGHLAPTSYLMQEAIASVGPGVALRITLERGGQVLELPVTTTVRPDEPRIDPVADFEAHLMARFEEDLKEPLIVVRVADRFSIAPKFGLTEGTRFQKILPAQDWAPEGAAPDRKAPEPTQVKTLEDLRRALRRAYLGGRLGATFVVVQAGRERGTSVAFDETWSIIL